MKSNRSCMWDDRVCEKTQKVYMIKVHNITQCNAYFAYIYAEYAFFSGFPWLSVFSFIYFLIKEYNSVDFFTKCGILYM
jgi:hypothetical protein